MTSAGFIWKNLYRKKTRTFLTFFCLFVAFLLYVALGSIAIVFSMDTMSGELGANRLQTTAKYSMIDDMPKRYVDEISQLEGVELVTHMTWFGGFYQEPTNMLVTFPVNPATYFRVFPEYLISDEHLTAFNETRRGFVAPAAMVQQYGWQIGDIVPIGSEIYPQHNGSYNWEFELVGTYTTERDGMSAVLINYDYFEEANGYGPGSVGWLGIQIVDPALAPEISQKIDAMYINSSDPVRTATESESNRQFLAQYGNITLMMSGILVAVFFTILLVCANTMSQAFRERIAELAVLKTIGFDDLKLGLWVLVEAVCLCVLPAIFGVLVGMGALYSMAASGMAAMFIPIPPMEVMLTTAASSLGLAAGLGALVGLLPAITTSRLSIVDA
ncbi:MAG: ABC transporter permease, partial [Gammaproteobacteria bacterium]|nr:ABC transporter permease [Gammaproteobacteria bacterium]